jgi:ribosomal protein S18 acetylase RimI-like enzyme
VRRVDPVHAGERGFVDAAVELFGRLVTGGAALGWVDPPDADQVADLLREVAVAGERGDACLAAVWCGPDLAGVGYWRRYTRPTHRPHADVEKLAVASACQGRGAGRALMIELIAAAADAGVEVLTLDFRGDNDRASILYRSLGFTEYGRLRRFVAVGSARYDKVFYARDLRDGSRSGATGSGTRPA